MYTVSILLRHGADLVLHEVQMLDHYSLIRPTLETIMQHAASAVQIHMGDALIAQPVRAVELGREFTLELQISGSA